MHNRECRNANCQVLTYKVEQNTMAWILCPSCRWCGDPIY